MAAERKESLNYVSVADGGSESVRVGKTRVMDRGLRYFGTSLGALGLVGLGAAIALYAKPQAQSTRASAVTELDAEHPLKKSCHMPEKWCHENPHRKDKLSYRDCDNDGILDPYCEGGELLRFGFISSKNNCEDNWPNGLCIREQDMDEASATTADKAAPNEITIISFNDVYNVAGVLEGNMRSGGMSRAAKVVKRERERNPDRTFVVFAGDLLSPSVLSDLFEGKQMVDILNSFELDAAALGNHEFDFGVDTLQERMKESNFPWLNINLMNEKNELLPHTTKYFIKDVPWAPRWKTVKTKKDTVRVCFFGVAYDVRETMFKDKERIGFKDVFNASRSEAEHLKKAEKCDVVIPLTHQFSNEDCRLSKELGTNVDLILGGHDHTTEYTSVCGHAPYLKAASDLKTQWVMTLWLNDEGTVQSIDGKLLALTDADPFDVDMHDRIVNWEQKGEEEMGKNIGCLKEPLDARSNAIRTGETSMGDFFTDAIRQMHGTDVVMVNGGTMRGDKMFSAGDLTKKRLVEMHPFGNAVAKIWATGKEIKEYINSNLNCWEDWCGNFVQISGLRYDFNPSLPKGERLVKVMTLDGKPIDEKKKFSVGITDYMLSSSPLKNNKLYNMGTLNDAVPIVMALVDKVKKMDGKCIMVATDGRITNLQK